MATYLLLSRYTEQGVKDIKGSPARIESFKKSARNLGAEVREVYLALGHYDTVSLVSAPDDEAMCKLALALGSLGNVRTQTLRLFSEGEFKKLVSSLPP
jgi:uncharacterized protein with GYD domain